MDIQILFAGSHIDLDRERIEFLSRGFMLSIKKKKKKTRASSLLIDRSFDPKF